MDKVVNLNMIWKEMVSIRQDIKSIKEDIKNIKNNRDTLETFNPKINDIHKMLKDVIQSKQTQTKEQHQEYYEHQNYQKQELQKGKFNPKQEQFSIKGQLMKQQQSYSDNEQEIQIQLSTKKSEIHLYKPKINITKKSEMKICHNENHQQIQIIDKIEKEQISLFQINKEVLSLDRQRKLAKVFDKIDLKFFTCEKIYDYPEMAHVNFHEKIDNKSNLLILIQMCNNQTIGAFTQLCFDPKPNYIPKSNPKSFLCNLSEERFLFASRINKTHSYDKNYLIFGNWEIKIKTGEKYLESSLGKKGSCFAKIEYEGEGVVDKDMRRWLFGQITDDSEDKRLEFKSYSIFIFQ